MFNVCCNFTDEHLGNKSCVDAEYIMVLLRDVSDYFASSK